MKLESVRKPCVEQSLESLRAEARRLECDAALFLEDRGEILSAAASLWHRAGRPDHALRLYTEAVAAGTDGLHPLPPPGAPDHGSATDFRALDAAWRGALSETQGDENVLVPGTPDGHSAHCAASGADPGRGEPREDDLRTRYSEGSGASGPLDGDSACCCGPDAGYRACCTTANRRGR